MKNKDFKLTEEQLRGLETAHAVGMVAGAGSGKTVVLTGRFIKLLGEAGRSGLSPEAALRSVVAMTYTKKAAAEMAARIADKCETLAREADGEFWHEVAIRMAESRIGTIHSFCAGIAGRYPFFTNMNLATEAEALSEDILARLAKLFCEDICEEDDSLRGTIAVLKDYTSLSDIEAALATAYKKRLIAGESLENMPETAAELLENWRSCKWRVFSLIKKTSLANMLAEMRGIYRLAQEAKSGDKLACVIRSIGEPPPDDLSAKVCLYMLDFIKIPLSIGSAQNWVGEETCKIVKEQIKGLRSIIQPITDFLPTELNESDTAFADATLHFARLYKSFARFADTELPLLGVLDFDELTISARGIIRETEFARDIAAGIHSLLIDEFQDTDPAQWTIASELASKIEGHLFWVGDPKQSIYRFRGADVSNVARGTDWILTRRGKIEELSDNFRTTARVLDFINRLGEVVFPTGNPMDFDFIARPQSLNFARTEPAGFEGKIEILLAKDDSPDEFELVAARIDKIVRGESTEGLSVLDGKAVRPAEWRDIAVLIPVRTRVGELTKALIERNIPFIQLGGKGFYSCEEVLNLSSLIYYLADGRDTVALASMLRSPLFALSDTSLFAVHEAGRGDIYSGMRSISKSGDSRLSSEEVEGVALALEILDEIVAMSKVAPASRVLSRMLHRTGAWATYSALPNGRQRIANIEKFIEICLSNDNLDLVGFAEKIRAKGSADESEASIESEGANAVKIMTVHQAKGLEFPITIVAGLGRKRNSKSDNFNFDPVFGPLLKPRFITDNSTVSSEIKKLESEREDAETRRLLYVAATRARDHLILSTNNWKGSFFKLISEGAGLCEPEVGISELDFGTAKVKVLCGIEAVGPDPAEMPLKIEEIAPIFTSLSEEDIRGLEAPSDLNPLRAESGIYPLRATDLPGFGKCPKMVLLESFESSPKASTFGGKSWGNVVHGFFEALPSPLPNDSDIVEIAESVIARSGWKPEGVGALIRLAADPVVRSLFSAEPLKDHREYRAVLRAGKLLLTGTIDRLWRDRDGWHILDYKSDTCFGESRQRKLEFYTPQLALYRRAVSLALGIPESEIEASILFTHNPVEAIEIPPFDLDSTLSFIEDKIEAQKETASAECEGCPYREVCSGD